MKTVWLIAQLSYREGLRHRIIYGVTVLSLALMAFSLLISGLFMRDILKIILDLCLTAITLSGLLVPFFFAVNVIAGDIDQRTIYTILARPVSKAEYILGKFLALILLTLTIMGGMTLATLLTLWLATFIYSAHFFATFSLSALLVAVIMKAVGIITLNAMALLWSTVTTSAFLATLLTLSTYIIGHTVEDMVRFIAMNHEGVEIAYSTTFAVKSALYLFPNLAAFDFSQSAAHGLAIAFSDIGLSLVYGIAYTSVVLLLAVYFFQKRDLP